MTEALANLKQYQQTPISTRIKTVWVAKQPIVDRKQHVVAEEWLFRDTQPDNSNYTGDLASKTVLLQALSEHTRRAVPAFINLTEAWLHSGIDFPLNKDAVVFEILETTPITQNLIKAVKNYHAKGYRFALDDFEFSQSQYHAILPYIDTVKLDVQALSLSQIRQHLQWLQPYNVKLLAEKIECEQRLKICFESGFDYFQGFLLGHPEGNPVKTLSPDRARLRAIQSVCQAILQKQADLNDLNIAWECAMASDLAIFYHSLMLAATEVDCRSISSVKDIVNHLSVEKSEAWLSMILADSVTTFQNPDIAHLNEHDANEPVSIVNVWSIVKRAQKAFEQHPEYGERDGFRFAAMLYATIHALDVPISDWLQSLPIDKRSVELVFWLRENGC